MYFELITGGAGSGKSGYTEEKIEECINAGLRAVVIVPERFSHMEESTLCNRFGGLGLNGIEVSTFSKLARRLAPHGEYLKPSGRQMLILKAADENRTAGDGIFETACERSGFIDKLSSAISEFKRCLVAPERLTGYNGGGLLEKKLHALGAVYDSYNRLIDGKFADPDEDMERLAGQIDREGGFSDTRIFIDGFSDFLPSHYVVISALIRRADRVYTALTVNDAGLRDEDSIFRPVNKCRSRLLRLAEECGAEVKARHFSGEYGYVKSEDVRYFLQNYDEYTPAQPPECRNISVTALCDRHAEIEWLAGRIMKEVRENGLRFRDIGVVVGNMDAYAHIINAVFAECGIPYFADRRIPASEHPVIRLVLSVMKILNENWSYESVFEYLRSGFIYRKNERGVFAVRPEEIDELELYVKSRGIRGKKAWLSEEKWQFKKEGVFDYDDERQQREIDIRRMDALRRELMSPFVTLTEKIRGRQRVRALAEGLFEFLKNINLCQGLEYECRRFEKKNMLDDAARLGEVWNLLIETLDQCVLTCGEELMSRENFARLLEAGLTKCAVDAVPSGADRVAVGSAQESRPVRVRALFAVGAVRGEMPCETAENGIINDADRAVLAAGGEELLPGADTRSELAEFNLYSSITAASERLYISMPQNNDEGAKNSPCTLVGELLRTFPKLGIRTPDEQEQWENTFTSKKRTYYKMLSVLAANTTETERDFWRETAPFVAEEEQTERVYTKKAPEDSDFSIFEQIGSGESILALAERYKEGSTGISAETAAELYGDRIFSTTALQLYNKCPFSYFVQYGLGVYPKEEFKLRSYELGQMIHWAVCMFCKRVQEGAETEEELRARWEGLGKAKTDEIIGELIEEIRIKSTEANPDFGTERITLMCGRAAKTLSRSAEVIRQSLISGGFSACEFEKDFLFGLESEDDIAKIKGTIDRIDIAPDGEVGVLLRIIDYKTGVQSFSVSGICSKTDLQLIIYALAAEKLYEEKNGRVAAVMYNSIKDNTVKTELSAPAAIMASLLDGVIVTEGDPGEAQADELALHDIALTENGAKSEYLPLKTKAKGGLAKNNAAISRERFCALERYVKKTIFETKKSIYNGEIAAIPAASGRNTPCQYCKFSEICLHSDERDGTRALVTSGEKAWEIIEKEDSAE